MKKIIATLMIMDILATSHVLTTGVNLDPTVLKEKKETYSSITDIYDITVFTDEYKDNINNKKELQENRERELVNKVFGRQYLKKPNNNLMVQKESEKYGLFSEKHKFVSLMEEKNDTMDSKKIVIILGCIFSIFTFVFTRKYYKKKFKRDDEGAYNINH